MTECAKTAAMTVNVDRMAHHLRSLMKAEVLKLLKLGVCSCRALERSLRTKGYGPLLGANGARAVDRLVLELRHDDGQAICAMEVVTTDIVYTLAGIHQRGPMRVRKSVKPEQLKKTSPSNSLSPRKDVDECQ